jgi:hypothetical protein
MCFCNLLLLIFLSSIPFIPALASSCPKNFIPQLHLILKSNMNAAWLDINENSDRDTCRFTLRYYPCLSQLQDQLSQSIQQTNAGCHFISASTNEHVEGYCAIRNIKVACVPFYLHP